MGEGRESERGAARRGGGRSPLARELRARLPPLAALLLVIAAGLGVRYGLARWPFVAKYGGVALWSCMAYAGLLCLGPRLAVRRAALLALALSFLVELAQLSPVPAYLSSRHILFRLLLGSEFSVYDLPAYAVGVALAAALHYAAGSFGTPRDRS